MGRRGQLVLFDAAPYRVPRLRRSSADNATKHKGGRLVVAGGLIVDGSGRILLIHRSTPSMDWWETPGGKVDRGERPREAAVREFSEELGVATSVINDLGWHDIESTTQPIRYALYLMQIDDGTPEPLESDRFDAVGFFSWKQMLSMLDDLSPNARNVFDMITRGRLRIIDDANSY